MEQFPIVQPTMTSRGEAARTAVVGAALPTSHPVLHWFHTDPATASKGETIFLNYANLEIGFK